MPANPSSPAPSNNEFIDAIGNTPLIRLRAVSELTGCDIYGKAEFMNPGGSVKDRAALAIIDDIMGTRLRKPPAPSYDSRKR